MTELTKSTVCPFCGSQLSSENRSERELEKQNAKLRSLLARMSEVGDELAGLTISWDEGSQKYFCAHTDCHGAKHWNEVVHDDDCPVTKWDALKKEMEG